MTELHVLAGLYFAEGLIRTSSAWLDKQPVIVRWAVNKVVLGVALAVVTPVQAAARVKARLLTLERVAS